MPAQVFKSGLFTGVSTTDAFAASATSESPVIVDLGTIAWPANLKPAAATLGGSYQPGVKIAQPLHADADVLVLLYTDQETSALLDVFTHNKSWTPTRKATWYPYSYNFDALSSSIEGERDTALKDGIFGYLSVMTIGTKRVVLYKSELHPKTNGTKLPFVSVVKQLVGDLAPKWVISTGTAGAIGSTLRCGDVAITSSARFHVQKHYAGFPDINTMSEGGTAFSNSVTINSQYLTYAQTNFTKLSEPGLTQCYNKLANRDGYGFLKKNTNSPKIYVTTSSPVPGPQPMDIVSADYLTVADDADVEGLQHSGVMNDTDDAFAFYAIDKLPASKRPKWLSIRNASEPQIDGGTFPAGATQHQKIEQIKGLAGAIYGVYQYCTTLNSALACWGVIAGM